MIYFFGKGEVTGFEFTHIFLKHKIRNDDICFHRIRCRFDLSGAVVFHELVENYYRTTEKKRYKEAHDLAKANI